MPREWMDVVTVYHAKYEFDNGVWLAELAEEPRVHSFGRSLHTAKKNLIDAAALWFEVDPQTFALRDVLPEQLADAQELVDAVTSTREDAELRGMSASLMTRATVRRLATETQLSQRDIASLLQLSHQRVQQILKPESTFHLQVLAHVLCDGKHDCDALLSDLLSLVHDELRCLVEAPEIQSTGEWGVISVSFVLDAKDKHEAEELACAATRSAFHAAGARTPQWEHVIRYPQRPAVVVA